MKVVIFLAGIVMLTSAIDIEFEGFKTKFGKVYKNSAEEEIRHKIFQDNLKIIADHNALYKQKKVSFDLAINQFADLTVEEFAEKYNRIRPSLHRNSRSVTEENGDPVPDSIDWRDSRCVTRVEDQGECGDSCVFSSVGSIEGQYCVETGKLLSMNYQRIESCCAVFGMDFCNGCYMDDVYKCLIILEGRSNESSPVIGQINEVCGADELTAGAIVTGYVDVLSKSEDALKNATALTGPISAAIDASHASIQHYNSGIYYEPLCSQNYLNQGVLVVGYGTESGEDYWLVKNSWGTNWGEQGFIKMARNRDNNCGIATEASYPVLEE